jgi:hypothetical protein
MSTFPSPTILTATARNRIVASYAVKPERVAPMLPAGLTPDTYDGQAYVSLVGVELVKVRVFGLVGPGFRRVPAVELQVVVQESEAARRGTLTVQAYVPRRLVAWAARGLYGEAVDVASMQPVWREQEDRREVTYRFDRAGREQRLRAVGDTPPETPGENGVAFFLMDRNWRFGMGGDGGTVRARLDRSVEPVCPVQEHHVTVRWASVYGDEWGFLRDREPAHVLLSPGGPIALHWREAVT